MNPLSRLVGRAVDKAIGLPPATATYVLRRDVGAPMPDGVVLLGDLYQPDGPDRARPVVLIRSPYGRAGIAGAVFAAPLARRGFQVFIQSTRGTFGSGGQFRPFLHEQEDGLATVAWLRQQAWCDGRVSMTGASYLGPHAVGHRALRRPAAGVGLDARHRGEDHFGLLRPRHAVPPQCAQLDGADRDAGTGDPAGTRAPPADPAPG